MSVIGPYEDGVLARRGHFYGLGGDLEQSPRARPGAATRAGNERERA